MKNLLGRLMSRPFDELKAISTTWGTVTRDLNPTQNDLAIAVYHTMVERSATRGVWENLDPEARAFLVWLLNQRNMLALADELPGHLDRPPEEVAILVERVRRTGLIDVEEALVRGTRVVSSGDSLYAWASRTQPEAVRRRVASIAAESGKVLREIIDESKLPPPFEEPFVALLDKLEQEEIQNIASVWRLPEARRYLKSELIGVMSEFLATDQGRELILKTLPASSQSVFAFLQAEGGSARAGQIKKQFEWDEREFRTAAVPLIQRALVWDVLSEQRRYLFVPQDLLTANREGGASVSPGMQPKLDAPAPYSSESRLPYEMAWDLLTLLASASQHELSLTLQDSRVTKRLAKKINDAFLHPGDMKAGTDYIDMVVHVATSLGLLSENHGEQPALALTPRTDEWAKLSFDAQRRRLFGLWQEDRKWAEPATYGTIYWWNSDLTGARKHLIAHLLELPSMQWTSVEAFLRKIHMTEPFLIWSQDELVKRFGLRALQGFRSQWFEIEGRIIADMLKTMLLWVGAVEVGRDKQRRFVSFRVLEEAQTLFNGERGLDGPHAPAKTLLVQPSYEVLVLHPESRVLWNLLRMSDLVRHDRVSVYVLNKESVLRAVEAGMPAESIRAFLDANTGKGLPQNVAHSIDDWARLIKNATVQRVTIIEVEDAATLDEMMASRKTRRYVSRRLSPTVAIANLPEVSESARDDAWQKLLKELKGAGYSPRYVNEAVQSASQAEHNGAQEPAGSPMPMVKRGDLRANPGRARGRAGSGSVRPQGEDNAPRQDTLAPGRTGTRDR